MNYKNYARSPNYGMIYAYDKDGVQVQELDILNLVLVDGQGREFKLKEALAFANAVPTLNDKITSLSKENEELVKELKEVNRKMKGLQEAIIRVAKAQAADKI